MAPIARLLILAAFLFFSPHPATGACYYPNGDLAPNDTPCRDDSNNSVCCGQGYACLSNGICQATGEELQKPGATEFVRGGCTDKTFRSSSCPLFCINSEVDNLAGGMGIAKCLNTTKDMYWCINGNAGSVSCEDQKSVLFFAGTPSTITTIGVSPSTSTTSSSTTSSSTKLDQTASTTINTSSSSSTADPNATSIPGNSGSSTESNKGATIGGAVGGACALLLIGAIALWLLFRNRKRKLQQENLHQLQEQTSPKPPDYPEIAPVTQFQGPYEAPSSATQSSNLANATPVFEASTVTAPQEMPTAYNVRG